MSDPPVHIISLGAGVQSSTMALMAAHGEIGPMPTAAIFADTQAEPPSVYKWLDWLEERLPFPVYRVSAGNLTDDMLRLRTSKRSGQKYMKLLIPAFVKKRAFEEFLNSLPEEVLRAKGLVVLREEPGEFQIFQKVGHDGAVQFFPIGQHLTLRNPVALFIGPHLPLESLREKISALS